MAIEWVLIANAARARLLERHARSGFIQCKAFEHVQSRLHSAELGDDKAGREQGASGFGGAAFEPRIAAHRKEALHFAHELAGHLEEAARGGRFDSLRIFASSPFLGELRQTLGDTTRDLLSGSFDVDLTSVGLAELGARIEHELAQPH